MNTRIRVEHPVSEAITGIDLVQEQFRIAAGEPLRFKQSDIVFRGHAVECRINAEIPEQSFRPNAGTHRDLGAADGPQYPAQYALLPGLRRCPMFYDSMLAKLIVYGSTRTEAIERMRRALELFAITRTRHNDPVPPFHDGATRVQWTARSAPI